MVFDDLNFVAFNGSPRPQSDHCPYVNVSPRPQSHNCPYVNVSPRPQSHHCPYVNVIIRLNILMEILGHSYTKTYTTITASNNILQFVQGYPQIYQTLLMKFHCLCGITIDFGCLNQYSISPFVRDKHFFSQIRYRKSVEIFPVCAG